jgi:sialic acid synthase SpsE
MVSHKTILYKKETFCFTFYNLMRAFAPDYIIINYNPNKMEEIEKALELLRNNGYYTDVMWHIHDIKSRHDCDNETAYEILDEALNNEATFERIWFAIAIAIEENKSKIETQTK